MIRGPKQKQKLTPENILSLISEENIFSYYLPDLQVGRAMLSPYRDEKHESFVVKNTGGKWWFRDMADRKYKGDCWQLVMFLFNLSFPEALAKIDGDFGLGLTNGKQTDYQKIVKSLPKHKEKPPAEIEVEIRAFTERELEYWARHLRTEEDLKRDEIFAVKQVWIGDKCFRPRGNELAFGYYFSELDKWKIYYPERVQGQGKWMGNIPNGYVEGKHNLISGQDIIIEGSRKDRVSTSAIYKSVLNTQNESDIAFTPTFVQWLKEREENIWILYDNDWAGFTSSDAICKEFGFNQLILPEGIKDVAQWVYDCGPTPLIGFLMENNII